MDKEEKNDELYNLTEAQILMLQFSDKDIQEGRVISQEELDKRDSDWFDELDRRYNDHINGVGKTYTWEETVAMARQALAHRKNKK